MKRDMKLRQQELLMRKLQGEKEKQERLRQHELQIKRREQKKRLTAT
jgi:hypothetical protein